MGRSQGATFVARAIPFILYATVPLLVLGPLLLPGFILTLDMVFSPEIKLAEWFYGTRADIWGELPAWALISLLGRLVPLWLVQKLLLVGILFLAGYSAHRLSPARSLWAKCFSGILYVLNPFVYVRFMAGQWQFLAGYALAPLAIKAALSFAQRPGVKKAVAAALLLSLVGVFSPHMMVMTLAAQVVIVLWHAARAFNRERARRTMFPHLAYGLVFAATVAAVSFYWLLPAFTHKSGFLHQIGGADLEVFSARPLTAGGSVFWAIASMHGFWRGGVTYISQVLPFWYLIALVFVFLAVHGFLSKFGDEKLGSGVKAAGLIGLGALLLGSGASSPFFAPAYEFMFNNLFFLRAFRDSQKLVALLVLAYCYLGALGAEEIWLQLRPKAGRPRLGLKTGSVALVVAVLALPFAYSLNMLWGFKGQLRPAQYPIEWLEANDFLNRQPGDFTVLFLPWHGFMSFSWTGRTLATPAKWFFDRPVLQSESLEVGPIDNESTDPAQHYVSFLLRNRDRVTSLGELLAPMNIKYVILAKEADYKEYDFLRGQNDLKVVLENGRLVLLENLHPVAPFYSVDASRLSSGWPQLLDAVGRPDVDLLDAVFILDGQTSQMGIPKPDVRTTDGFQPVEYQRLSPVRYDVGPVTGKYLVAALPYDPAWRLNGAPGVANLEVTNAFVTSGNGQRDLLYHSRYAILLFGYFLSGTAGVGVGVLWYLSGRRQKTPPLGRLRDKQEGVGL